MKTISVFEVRQNADMTEGRGPMVHHSFFTHEADAMKVVEPNKGWYDYIPCELMIFDNFSEYNDKNQKDIIRGALRKLSTVERIALGLNETHFN